MSGTYTNLLYHIVFSTKQRIPLITSGLKDELNRYVGGIVRGEGGTLLEINGMPDHVHLLTKFKPTLSVSEMLQRIKGNSSKWANDRQKSLRKFGWQKDLVRFRLVAPKLRTSLDIYATSKSTTNARISNASFSNYSKNTTSNTTNDICGTDIAPPGLVRQWACLVTRD